MKRTTLSANTSGLRAKSAGGEGGEMVLEHLVGMASFATKRARTGRGGWWGFVLRDKKCCLMKKEKTRSTAARVTRQEQDVKGASR